MTPVIGPLNEVLRRFLQYKDETEWRAILLDGTAGFAPEVALFTLQSNVLKLCGARGLTLNPDLQFSLDSASAFQNALTSIDVVVTLATAREVGAALAGRAAANNKPTRAYVFPILNGTRPVAALYAPETDRAEMAGVDLVCGLGALVLQRQSNVTKSLQISAASKPAVERKLPPFANLTDEERNANLRALRFARVKVAEMQMAHPDSARAGREQNNLYLFLKSSIDAARDTYRTQFGAHRGMIDHLHSEIVRSLADGDESKLGEEYPGSLDESSAFNRG